MGKKSAQSPQLIICLPSGSGTETKSFSSRKSHKHWPMWSNNATATSSPPIRNSLPISYIFTISFVIFPLSNSIRMTRKLVPPKSKAKNRPCSVGAEKNEKMVDIKKWRMNQVGLESSAWKLNKQDSNAKWFERKFKKLKKLNEIKETLSPLACGPLGNKAMKEVQSIPLPSGNSGMYVFSIKTDDSSHCSLRARFISFSNWFAIRLTVGSLKKSPLRTSLI